MTTVNKYFSLHRFTLGIWINTAYFSYRFLFISKQRVPTRNIIILNAYYISGSNLKYNMYRCTINIISIKQYDLFNNIPSVIIKISYNLFEKNIEY